MLRLLSNLHLSELDSYLLSAWGFMMKTWIIALFNFLLLAMCGVTSARAATTLSGKVVDETGKPVVGIEVGQAWLWNIFDKDSFRTYGSVKTDADGLFTYRVEEPHYPLTLFAADAHGQRGAVVTITEHKATDVLTLKLGLLIPTQYKLRLADWQGEPPFFSLTIRSQNGTRFMTLRTGLTGTAPLPVGDYVFQASSRDTVACQIPFRVGANSKEANIGNISMEIGPIAKNYGKPALPLKITDAIGVTKDFHLSDLKGKWVLIDFWGYWCGPCVGEALPKLADFYRTHQNKTDKFAILAFHENSVKTVKELKPKLRRLETEVWKGQPLPFPILLDSTGQTIKLWGVASYPTTILIDPDGHFYRGGSLDVLKQKVEQTAASKP